MGYSQSVYFIPVWFDDYSAFIKGVASCAQWEDTAPEKLKTGYLLHYAAGIAQNPKLFRSYSLKAVEELKVYMFREEMHIKGAPHLDEVRLSCFATGVGFMEFWVSYSGMSSGEIVDFAYLFKKATKRCNRELPGGQMALYDVAQSLLPQKVEAKLFFSACERFKYECNCYHFQHIDGEQPARDVLNNAVNHLSRSYKASISTSSAEGDYDMVYGATPIDYWGISTEGLANLVFDSGDIPQEDDYYWHTLKLQCLRVDYYFLYLLLLNQKYTAIQYIQMVSAVLEGGTKDVEQLNRRIVQLKNTFSFNVISDDRIFQNVYTKIYTVLEIKALLADVIENESQMEYLEDAKHAYADRQSNKYLLGISILSLFSALIDAASYFDRFDGFRTISTWLGSGCVLLIFIVCLVWAFKSVRK